MEVEAERKINFLDLCVTRSTPYLSFDLYREPTYTGAIAPSSSNPHFSHKNAAFNALFPLLFK